MLFLFHLSLQLFLLLPSAVVQEFLAVAESVAVDIVAAFLAAAGAWLVLAVVALAVVAQAAVVAAVVAEVSSVTAVAAQF